MYSPCRPSKVFAQRMLYLAVRLLGPRALPGERGVWPDPVESEVWENFVSDWEALFGRWDSAVLYRRPQTGRSGFALLLLRGGRAIGFARVTTSPERAAAEHDVMARVFDARPHNFASVRPLGWGTGDGWAWLATESGPNYPLGAVKREPVRRLVTEEITAILDQTLPRPADTPRHWRGSHGDLAPWNLRTEWNGRVRVIDWEDAGFAPPGTDLLYSELTAHVTFGTPIPPSINSDAADWVTARITARRSPDEQANSINNRLLAAITKLRTA